VDAGEVFDLAAPGLRIHSLRIPLLTYFQRRINEDFEKTILSYHRPHFIASGAIRTNRGRNHYPAVAHDLRRDEPDPPYVRVAIVLIKSEALRKMRADDVAIEQRGLTSMLQKFHRKHFGRD